MALSTDQYGYLIDPLVPITDATGTTIKDGFLRVYIAGSSTPVITYRNYDGAANEQTIELDNSGRCKYPVIVSKSLAYKVVVYDAQHSQETPIITVDKMFAIGSSVTAGAGSTIVQGLDNVEGESDGFVKASVTGTTASVKLDAANVSHELTSDAAVGYASNAGYMVPALSNDSEDPGDPQKLPLAWIWGNRLNAVHTKTEISDFADENDGFLVDSNAGPKFMKWKTLANKVLGFIKSLSTTITAFRTGDVIPVDGPSGTAKMGKDDLLRVTAESALADNLAPAFDPDHGGPNNDGNYPDGYSVIYLGKLYTFNVDHSGAWNSSHVDATNTQNLYVGAKEFGIWNAKGILNSYSYSICKNKYSEGEKIVISYTCDKDVSLVAKVNGSTVTLKGRGRSATVVYDVPSGFESLGFFVWESGTSYDLNVFDNYAAQILLNRIDIDTLLSAGFITNEDLGFYTVSGEISNYAYNLFVNPFAVGKTVRLAYECSQDVLLIAKVNGSNVQLTSRGKSASIEYTIPSGCESFGFFAWTFPCKYTLNAYSDTYKKLEDDSILSQDVANNIVKPLTRNLLDGFGNPSVFNNRYCKKLDGYLIDIGASLSVKKENGTEFSRISIPTGCSIPSTYASINLFDFNTTYDSDGYAECYVSAMVRNTASNSNLGFRVMTNNSWSSPNEILRNESDDFTLLRTHVTSSGTPGARVNFKLRMYFSGGSTYTTTEAVTFDFYNMSMSLVDVDKYQSIKINEPQAYEKRIMFLGDSITTESYYAPILRDLLHCTGYYNLAVIGATLCDKADQTPYDGNPSKDTPSQNVLGNQLQKILNNSTIYTANPPDIILIAIGTNDSGPNDSEDDINDIETYFTSDGGNTIVPCTPATFDSSDTYEPMRKHFAGAMRYVVSNLQVLFPNAKIFISTPIQAAVGTRYTRNIEVKQQLLSKLSTRLSVTAIHTGEHCGIAQDFEYNGYFWDAGLATVSHPHNGRDLIDGIHPNSSGSNKMAKYIYSVIKNEFV